MQKIPLSKCFVNAEVEEAALRALRSGQYILAKECQAFEAELAAHTGTAQCILGSSWTMIVYMMHLAQGLKPGDEVIVPSHTALPTMEPLIHCGATPVFVDIDDTFCLDAAQVEAAVTPRTKALLFVSPSNPTGAVYPRGEIEAIGQWAVDRGLWVLTDEIYEHLVYGGAEHHSMPVLVPELADRCLVVNGVAKTYAMTGWRVGWLIGPVDAVTAATNIQSHETSNVANVSQRAALAALSGGLDDVAMMRAAFDRRRVTITRMLNEIDGVVCPEPEGAFYAFPSVKGLLGKSLRGQRASSSAELAELCINEAKVAVVPGEAFGAPGFFRMSYALGDDDLVEGVSRLASFFAEAKD